MTYDCIVVGGGPAGLSAALMLGRCRRSVLVCDAGEPRNARSAGLHGYLTRDGMQPGRVPPPGSRGAASGIPRSSSIAARSSRPGEPPAGSRVVCAGGLQLSARKLLLATGVVDELPDIEGFRELYGKSVHHCPYCDAWEWRDQPLAVYGRAEAGTALALALTVWSDDVVLCTDGPSGLSEEEEEQLDQAGIEVREDPVVRLEGRDGLLERVDLRRGRAANPASALLLLRPAAALPACRTARRPVQREGRGGHRQLRGDQRPGPVRGGRCVEGGAVRRRGRGRREPKPAWPSTRRC